MNKNLIKYFSLLNFNKSAEQRNMKIAYKTITEKIKNKYIDTITLLKEHKKYNLGSIIIEYNYADKIHLDKNLFISTNIINIDFNSDSVSIFYCWGKNNSVEFPNTYLITLNWMKKSIYINENFNIFCLDTDIKKAEASEIIKTSLDVLFDCSDEIQKIIKERLNVKKEEKSLSEDLLNYLDKKN